MGVDYAEGFFETPVLDKTHHFAMKRGHVVFANLQYWKIKEFKHDNLTRYQTQ